MPEDTEANTLGGEPQHANSFIVSGLPQVYTVNLAQSEKQSIMSSEPTKMLLLDGINLF